MRNQPRDERAHHSHCRAVKEQRESREGERHDDQGDADDHSSSGSDF
jgi:hypothetical protein